MLHRLFINFRLAPIALGCTSAIALTLGGCAGEPTDGEAVTNSANADDDDLQIVTTFLPITQFTKAVVGDRADVVQLLPPNVGPHDFQAKPADALAIANADVLVQNGLELEAFLDDLIANANNADLVIIDSSEGIPTIAFQDEGHSHGAPEDSHDHVENPAEEEDDHGHDPDDHSIAEGDEHGGETHAADPHHHGEFDPHIWLDPKRAIGQIENIRDSLNAIDPEGETDYTANAAAYIEQLQALDQEITERLAPYAGQTFISFHDFAFYFAASYGLNVEYLVDIPEENPSPDDVRRIIETTQAENLNALLTEPQVGEAAFAALAKDLNVEISAFDPMETGDTASTEPEYYLTIMRRNVESLEEALGE